MKNKLIQILSVMAMVLCFVTLAAAQSTDAPTSGGFFSAENLITVIVGGAASLGVTQWLKSQSGAYGVAAMVLAVVVAFVVGFIALFVSSLISGNPVNWASIPTQALQLFGLATMAYKLLIADQA